MNGHFTPEVRLISRATVIKKSAPVLKHVASVISHFPAADTINSATLFSDPLNVLTRLIQRNRAAESAISDFFMLPHKQSQAAEDTIFDHYEAIAAAHDQLRDLIELMEAACESENQNPHTVAPYFAERLNHIAHAISAEAIGIISAREKPAKAKGAQA